MVKKIVIVFFTFVIISSIVYGNMNRASVYLSSKQDIVEQGEEIEISVRVEDVKIVACNFSVYFDESKVEYLSKVNDIGNSNVIGNRVIFVWFDELGGEGAKEGELVTFRFRAKEKGLVTFSVEGEFYSEKGQLIETDFKEKQVQIGKEESSIQSQIQEEEGVLEEQNTNLEILAIENVLLYPPFDPSVTNYKAEVSNKTNDLNVFAVAENEEAVVQITKEDELQEGNNLLTVIVTSSNDSMQKEYQVDVYKRNVEEEKRYEEEQAKNKEALENAYKIEKTYADIMNIQEQTTKEQTMKYKKIFGFIILIVFLILIAYAFMKELNAPSKK